MISRRDFLAGVTSLAVLGFRPPGVLADTDDYLAWTPEQCERIARATRQTGKVGSRFNERLLKTERAVNYKMIATWMTPDVIRATARWLQIGKRLPVDRTTALVAEAESAGGTVFMIELDPREGSGVIPNDWEAYLQARDAGSGQGQSVQGVSTPRLRSVAALAGIDRRNYDYDRFWVVFPLTSADGAPLFAGASKEAELIVRVYSQEEHTYWPISPSIRTRAGGT